MNMYPYKVRPIRLGLLLLVAALVLVGLSAFPGSTAYADHDPADTSPDPDSVTFTLEGCRQESLPAGYDIEGNNFSVRRWCRG